MHTLLHSVPPTLQQATTDPHLHRDSRTLMSKSGSVSCGVIVPFSWVLVQTRFCLCPPRVCPQSYVSSGGSMVGLMVDLLQEGLCHTQVSCTQSPCPCGRPLLTHTSTGDTQTQYCLCLHGVFGSWCTQGLFEPSECLWRIWDLILNSISPLLPSCWGLSFALGHGVSPQSCSRAAKSPLQCQAAAAHTAYFTYPKV